MNSLKDKWNDSVTVKSLLLIFYNELLLHDTFFVYVINSWKLIRLITF